MNLTYVLITVALVILATVFSILLAKRRRTAWQSFAAAHHLRLIEKPVPHVVGTINGRNVELIADAQGSDTKELSTSPVRLSVRLSDAAPPDLRILETRAVVGRVSELIEEDVLQTGDSAFDECFTVHAESWPAATHYLNRDRRQALLALADDKYGEHVELHGPQLTIETRMLISDQEQLDDALKALLSCADHLDRSGGATSMVAGR